MNRYLTFLLIVSLVFTFSLVAEEKTQELKDSDYSWYLGVISDGYKESIIYSELLKAKVRVVDIENGMVLFGVSDDTLLTNFFTKQAFVKKIYFGHEQEVQEMALKKKIVLTFLGLLRTEKMTHPPFLKSPKREFINNIILQKQNPVVKKTTDTRSVADLTGTVTAGGSPVESVVVNLYDINGTYYSGAVTDATGNYSFLNMPIGNFYKVRFIPSATYVSEWHSGVNTSADATAVEITPVSPVVDATLEQGGTISGTVTNGVRAAIPGVEVLLYEQASGAFIATKVTDAGGNYSFPILAGTYQVYFALTGYPTKTYSDVAVTTGQTTIVDTTFATGSPISGTVTEGASGLDGVKVHVYYTGGGNYIETTITSGGGNYTTSALETTSQYDLYFVMAGYATQIFTGVAAGANISPVFTAGSPISGTVTDGAGLDGVKVHVYYAGGGNYIESTITSGGGNYTTSALSTASQYDLYFVMTGYTTQVFTNVAAGATINPVFSAGTDLTGTVTNARAAIQGVKVYAYNQTTGAYIGMGVTDATGFYTITDLENVNHKIWFIKSGYAKKLVTNVTPASSPLNQILEVSGAISGTVRDSVTLNPLPTVKVYTMIAGVNYEMGVTDANGNFTVTGLGTAAYDVLFRKKEGGYVVQTISGVSVTAPNTTAMGTIDLVPLK